MLFKKPIESFNEYLRIRNFSEHTIDLYSTSVRKFATFLEEHYKRINSLEKITKDILRTALA
jgi:site-specific recombinase XerD